jgi:hypothetical protein
MHACAKAKLCLYAFLCMHAHAYATAKLKSRRTAGTTMPRQGAQRSRATLNYNYTAVGPTRHQGAPEGPEGIRGIQETPDGPEGNHGTIGAGREAGRAKHNNRVFGCNGHVTAVAVGQRQRLHFGVRVLVMPGFISVLHVKFVLQRGRNLI